jgi:hypothetical protein
MLPLKAQLPLVYFFKENDTPPPEDFSSASSASSALHVPLYVGYNDS